MGNSESRSTPTNKPPTPPEVKQSDISWMDGWRADVKFLEAASKKGHELGKTPVVLVGSGAFCPVHRGHLLMMRTAAKTLTHKRYIHMYAFQKLRYPPADCKFHSFPIIQ